MIFGTVLDYPRLRHVQDDCGQSCPNLGGVGVGVVGSGCRSLTCSKICATVGSHVTSNDLCHIYSVNVLHGIHQLLLVSFAN